ncbi:MAG: proline dehydrogenase family protein [Flavobacteriales bacterium]|nr:proline dehydrogenase family protein [Flavobacteriales bacterium]
MQQANVSQQPGTSSLPDLGNTATAFAHKSNNELWQAYWLFRIIGTPWLTNLGSSLTKLALGLHLPVKGIVKATVFRQFCGGENIEESLRTARKLAKRGVGTILDYSVEGEGDQAAMDGTAAEILRTIAAAKGNPDIPFSVFKPSGLIRHDVMEKVSAGAALSTEEAAAWQQARSRVERICQAAFDAGVPLLIDAEESWTQPAVDALVTEMMERFNKERALIYGTAQMYRHDRLAFLRRELEQARAKGYHVGMKLVRGAYMEKERERAAEKGYQDPIGVNKAAVDADYDASLRFCMDNLDRMAVLNGTHNETSSLLLARLMQQAGVAKNDPRIHFGQLLGMSDHISFNMAAAGYNVVKYVPYGPVRKVLPYLIRRAEENTSARGQTGRELSLIIAERKRRAAGK